MTGQLVDAARAALEILDAASTGRSIVVITVVSAGSPEPGRVAVSETGEALGSLGDAGLDGEAVALARAALADPSAEGGLRTLGLGESSVEVYLELHRPSPELIVVGAGHIAQPLTILGDLLGYAVTVVDDRPEFATRERFPCAAHVVRVDFTDPFRDLAIGASSHVVLVTRGHRYDYECLRRLLRMDPLPAYIGMIGSRRRVRATYAQLLEEGVAPGGVASVRAPVGLDLGAETPAEIAVSIAAELVHLKRGGSAGPLRDREQVVGRFFGGDVRQEVDDS